jgi:hypothetical protein
VKYFVPLTDDDEQTEMIWPGLRERMFDFGLPTTRRRIEALSLDDRRPGFRLEIGDETPDTGEPVLVILEASDAGLYYVFTPDHGLISGAPYPVGLDEHGSAIPFEETAIERLWGDYLK